MIFLLNKFPSIEKNKGKIKKMVKNKVRIINCV